MPDLSAPLEWPHGTAKPRVEPAARGLEGTFAWPTPPFACYPQATAQAGPEACEILGLNNARNTGHVILIAPEERVAQINVPPARNAMPLKFSQFRALKLLRPLKLLPQPEGGALKFDERPRAHFKLRFNGGGEMKGQTVGFVQDEMGLFLFPPISDKDDAVLRVFIPAEVLESFEVGERIGDLLVKDKLATPEQIESAANEQADLRSRRVGDILVSRQIVTAAQLISAIDQQAKMPMVRIGEALLAMELITQADLDDALAQQRQDRSVPLGEILVRKGVVSRQALQSALARKMGYPLVDVENFEVEPDAITKLPYAVAKRLEVLPLVLRDGRMIVAMEDPTRRVALEEVEFIAQLKVTPTLSKIGALQYAIPHAYERFGSESVARSNDTVSGPMTFDFAAETSGALMETLEREGAEDTSHDDDKSIEQSDNSLVRLINTMIIEAHGQHVSDIHIECQPGKDKVRVRFRKDGVLKPYLELPHTYRNAMIARIKIMCDLDISERRKPQDGKINFARFSAQHRLELRVATIPTNNGLEDVVMRLLASSKPLPLDKIGLSPANFAKLTDAVKRPYGMVLCVGPTGSGKTTTLHSALGYINTPDRKIWTAEDPVEITQAGLRQVQVNPRIEWTFAKALRAFLRADPDVIMVGEIRDEETAEIAVEASLTGHLVLSTLHTNSAPETVTRLLDMGLDPFNFADSLLAILAQRLVRRICSSCRVVEPMPETEVDELMGDYLHVFAADGRPDATALRDEWTAKYGQEGKLVRYRSPGCAKCENSGFKGRAGLHELMPVSKTLRRLIQTGSRAEELAQTALAEGMRTLRQDGIEKVLAGVTSIEEVRATSNS